MRRYFCIGFIDFILKGKNLLDYANLFSLNEYEKNEKNNIAIFSIESKKAEMYCNVCNKYRKLKITKNIFLKKH